MLLYGRNSVIERLKVNPHTIEKILLEDSLKLPDIDRLAKTNKIPLEILSFRQLSRIKPAKNLQGIIARVEPFKYSSFDDLLAYPNPKELSFIFLDRINDPQNLGAIIRTSACFGNFAIVIPKHESCEVTETVLHVASGGENYVKIARVSNLSKAIIQAKERGYYIVGAEVDNGKSLDEFTFLFPLGFVLGFEGKGIRYGVSRHLDAKVTIPMKGVRLSLNVAVSCAIFCHEIAKQKKGK